MFSLAKTFIPFMCAWLVSSVAFSGSSLEPELQIVERARSSAEYPILRRIQDLTLQLQLLEITVKNRRDPQIEEKIGGAIKGIENEGVATGERFKAIRARQLEELAAAFTMARRYGRMMGVADAEWQELFGALRDGQIKSGMLTVHARAGVYNLLSLAPLAVGKQYVWNVTLPEQNRSSYWIQARAHARALGVRGTGALAAAAMSRRIAGINAPYPEAEKLLKDYFNASYARLYSAFEHQRYAILQRVQQARNALIELQKNNGAMGTPEEYSTLYNQVLENLFSYGVDIALDGAEQRDFAVKGFLFAESPERSEELLRKLRFTPSSVTYSAPST